MDYGGIDAIEYIRGELKDLTVDSIHVIFYTAYKEYQVRRIDSQKKFRKMENHSLYYAITALLEASVQKTVEARKNPIIVNPEKPPT